MLLRDRAERQQAEHAAAQAPDRLPALPAPLALARLAIVLGDLARRREPQRDGVIGDLVGAPLVRRVGHLDARARVAASTSTMSTPVP